MIDSPGVVVTAIGSNVDAIHPDSLSTDRVTQFLKNIREKSSERNFRGCFINVHQAIPSHRGLGSGTQLGLAVAAAVSIVADEPAPGIEILARRVGRGLRSAVGLYGFVKGGFLVDGGRANADRLGTLVSRVDFPPDWRFVLAMPRQSIGLSGEAEQTAFAQQAPMPAHLTAELCRIVLMDWLTSVIETNFKRCSESMFRFGHMVGEFFSVAQGGVFANPRMSEWVCQIRKRGIEGVAQTSWGPTVAALCHDQHSAEQLKHDFETDENWSDTSFEIVAPLNRGATVTIDSSKE